MKGIVVALVTVLISFSASASISCQVKDMALSKLPGGIAIGLECKNKDAILEDVSYLLDRMGICTDPDEKSAWGILCRKFLPVLIDEAVDYPIPEDWECEATTLKETLTFLFTQYCDQL